MKCIALLAILVVIAYANAGKVTIRGECVDCNQPTTVKPTSAHPRTTKKSGSGSGRHQTTAKPNKGKGKAGARTHDDSDDDDDDLSSLSQFGGGVQQHIGRGRHRRQWYSSGGHVIDGSAYPGTVVRNDDCRNCNIRGG